MKPQVISFHYTLTDDKGQKIESSYGSEPVVSMEGSQMILPALEKELNAMKPGDKKKISLKAADAYGDHDKNLILQVPREQLPKAQGGVTVGQQYQSQGPDGMTQVFRVTSVNASHATLDGNHPLAGQDLNFEIELTERRDATEEEVEHGHAHGPDGHHHH